MFCGDKVSQVSLGSQYVGKVKEQIRLYGYVKTALANDLLDYIFELEAQVAVDKPSRFGYVTKERK